MVPAAASCRSLYHRLRRWARQSRAATGLRREETPHRRRLGHADHHHRQHPCAVRDHRRTLGRNPQRLNLPIREAAPGDETVASRYWSETNWAELGNFLLNFAETVVYSSF